MANTNLGNAKAVKRKTFSTQVSQVNEHTLKLH